MSATYEGSRESIVCAILAAEEILAMATRTDWTGTASDLLGALGEIAGDRLTRSRTWPNSPRALAGRLRRAVTFLRKIGIEVGFGREGRARTRVIHYDYAELPSAGTGRGASVHTVCIACALAEFPSDQRLRGTRPADDCQ